uniref:P-type domain-containing protein n=1 Tax=Clytia hemisphaerica TaxID=252671 RepID=A0A7M5XH61_9CNID
MIHSVCVLVLIAICCDAIKGQFVPINAYQVKSSKQTHGTKQKLGFFGPMSFKKGPWHTLSKQDPSKTNFKRTTPHKVNKSSTKNTKRYGVPYAGVGYPYYNYNNNLYGRSLTPYQGYYDTMMSNQKGYFNNYKKDFVHNQYFMSPNEPVYEYSVKPSRNQNPKSRSDALHYRTLSGYGYLNNEELLARSKNKEGRLASRSWQKPWSLVRPLEIKKHVQRMELEKHGDDYPDEGSNTRPDLMLPRMEERDPYYDGVEDEAEHGYGRNLPMKTLEKGGGCKPCQNLKPGEKIVPLYMCCAKVGPDGKPVNPKIAKQFPHIDQCAMPDNQRKECGFMGITKAQCEAKKCCWRPLGKGSTEPWCYHPKAQPPIPPIPGMPGVPAVPPTVPGPPKVPKGPDGKPPKGPDGKVVTPTGPDGKPEGEKGPDGKPKPPDTDQCVIEPDQRKECGFMGIKQPECEGKGCCWRPLENGSKAPWCFFPAKKEPGPPVPAPPGTPGVPAVPPTVPGPPKVPKGPDGKPPKGPDGKVVTPTGPDGKPEGEKGPDGKPTPPNGDQCEIEPDERKECGYMGIKQPECEGKGCCWKPLENGSKAPWCFFPAKKEPGPPVPAPPGHPGVPAVPPTVPGPPAVPKGPDGKPPKGPDGKVVTPTGPDGKPEGEKGPDGKPTPPEAEQCEIKPSERKECGYFGIKKPECVGKGCCWKPLENGSKAPWCFFPAKKEPGPPVPAPPGHPGVPAVPPTVLGPPAVPKGPDGKPPKGPDGKVVTPTGPDGKPEGEKGPDGKPTPPESDQCEIEPDERKECGYMGIKQPECEGKGCCWKPLENGSKAPWCFFPAKKEPGPPVPAPPGTPGVPAVPPTVPGPPEVPKGPDGKPPKGPDGKVVTPTGPDGKPEGEKGPDGTPTPPDSEQCEIEPDERKECGFMGIKQPECEGKGCCWRPLENGSKAPWCFFPAKKEPGPPVPAPPGTPGVPAVPPTLPGPPEVPKGPDGKPPKGPDGKVVTPTGPDGKPEGEKGPDGKPTPPDSDQCDIEPSARKECGYFGIKKPECEGKGCCWKPLENGSKAPWCFYPAKKEPGPPVPAPPGTPGVPAVPPVVPGPPEVPKGPDGKPPKGPDGKVVTPTGPDGKPEGEKGPDGTPTPPDSEQCEIEPDERKECGYMGIKQPECESKGCCWRPLENGSKAPWCFFPAKKEPGPPVPAPPGHPGIPGVPAPPVPGPPVVPKGPDGKPPKGPDGKVVTPTGPDGKPEGEKGPDGKPTPPEAEQCDIESKARKECGYFGIKKPECEGKGCCWKPLENGSKAPWCFYPAKKEPGPPVPGAPGVPGPPEIPTEPEIPYTCRDLATNINDDGRGNAVYLDRHDVKCDDGEALSGFHLKRSGGNKYQITYKCCKTPKAGTPTPVDNPFTDDGRGGLVYLDRQDIKCENSYLSTFKMNRKPGGGQYRFSYTCYDVPGEKQCQALTTKMNADGGGNGNAVYLDRHDVKCPDLHFLSRWHLKRDGKGDNVQFEYTCCKGLPQPEPSPGTPGPPEVPKGPDGKPPKGPDGKVVTPTGPDGKPEGEKGPDGTPTPPDNEQCEIEPDERKECGYMGIKQPECEGKGCCWRPLENGSKAPWCFFPAKKEPTTISVPVPPIPGPPTPSKPTPGVVNPEPKPKGPDGKVETPTGPNGEPEGEKGPDGSPTPPDNEQCEIEPDERKECGYMGIKQPECEGKGCCWRPLENGSKAPWCFFPAKKEPGSPDTTPPELKPDNSGNTPTPNDPETGKPAESPEPQKPTKPEPQTPEEKEKAITDAKDGKGDDNPKKQQPQPCTTPDCQTNLFREYKKKTESLITALITTGGNHGVELYSTGCSKKDCTGAVGMIKLDGTQVGGGTDGMNIVVLSYPSYEIQHSKVYETGTSEVETEKMVKFIGGIKAPSIIMIVAQGEVFGQMTDDAWTLFDSLGCCRTLIKTSGSSFAMLTYKGTNTLPWIQVQQRPAGMGASAIFAILGQHTEYMAFGGSGGTITNLIKGFDEAQGGGRRHIQYAPMIEAESENEPQRPLTMLATEASHEVPVVELRPTVSSNKATYYTNEGAKIDGFIGDGGGASQTESQMLEGDMIRGIDPRTDQPANYETHIEGAKRKKDDKEDKKPKVIVYNNHPYGGGFHQGAQPHPEAHVEGLHHPQLLPYHPELDGDKVEHGKYNPNQPVQGTLVHTGQMAYDPHHTAVHEVYRPKNLNNQNEEQIWVPHFSNHNEGLNTFEDNQHGQIVSVTPDQHPQDFLHNDVHEGFRGPARAPGMHGFQYENHHQEMIEPYHGGCVDCGYNFPSDGSLPPGPPCCHHPEPPPVHHCEHPPCDGRPPILNIPHPYVITSNEPMGPEDEHFSKENNSVPISHTPHVEAPFKIHSQPHEIHRLAAPVHAVHPAVVHGAQYGLPHAYAGHPFGPPHIHPPPPHNKKEDKKPKKAEDIHQPAENYVKAKLKEMLTTELNKKLDELNLKSATSGDTRENKGNEILDFENTNEFSSDENQKSQSNKHESPDQHKEMSAAVEEEHHGSSNPNANPSSDSDKSSSSNHESSSNHGSSSNHQSSSSSSFSHETKEDSKEENGHHSGSSNPNNNESSLSDEEKIPSAKKVKNDNKGFSSSSKGSDSGNSGGSSSGSSSSSYSGSSDSSTSSSGSSGSLDSGNHGDNGKETFKFGSNDDFQDAPNEQSDQKQSQEESQSGPDSTTDLNNLDDGYSRSHSPKYSLKKKGSKITSGVLRSKSAPKYQERCKRYRVLKNGKKLKLKFNKKNCVEKEPPTESGEGTTDAKQDNDYSYYENNNKMKVNPSQDYLSDFKDSVYATNTENIYDQGGMNVAQSILQKDVSEAYKTANDILKVEDALDKNSKSKLNAKRKKKHKIDRHAAKKRVFKKKTKPKATVTEDYDTSLDDLLDATSFDW